MLASGQAKKVIKEHGNIEAYELHTPTDKIQCTPLSQMHDIWSRILQMRILVYDNQDSVIKDEIRRHVMQPFELLTSAAFFMIKGKTGGRKFGLSDEQQEREKTNEALRNSRRKDYTSLLADGQSFFILHALQDIEVNLKHCMFTFNTDVSFFFQELQLRLWVAFRINSNYSFIRGVRSRFFLAKVNVSPSEQAANNTK